MLLRSIRLSHWRSILGELSLGPFSEGITIVHAPNGTGKSSLLEALRMALLENHNTKGARVMAVQPWGRGLAPEVSVDFFHGGREYRIEKRFLECPMSRLSRQEGQGYLPFAEGPAADRMVRDLFVPSFAGRGAPPTDWGLLQVLWVPQGELPLKDMSADTLAAVRTALSDQVADEQTTAFERRLDDRYGYFFTETGRLKRTSTGRASPLAALSEKCASKEAELAASVQEYDEFNVLADEVSNRRETVRTLEAACSEGTERRKAAEQRVAEYEELLRERRVREAAAGALEVQHGVAAGRLRAIEGCRLDLKRADEELKGLEAALPGMEDAVRTSEAVSAQASKGEKKLEGERKILERLQDERQEAERFFALDREIVRSEEAVREGDEAEKKIAGFRRERRKIVLPPKEEMDRARVLQGALQSARTLVEALSVAVDFEPLERTTVREVDGGHEEVHTVLPGELITFENAPEVVLEIESVGMIRASIPGEDAEGRKETLESARTACAAFLETWGAGTMEELEERRENARRLDQLIAVEEARLSATLGGPAKDMKRSLRALRRQRDDLYLRHPAWREAPPVRQELDDALAARRKRVAALADEQSRATEEANRRAEEARSAFALHERDMRNQREKRDTTAARLKELEGDGLSLTERRSAMDALALRWDGARAKVAAIDDALKAFAEDPLKVLDALRVDEERTVEEKAEAERALIAAEARLDVLAAKAPFSTMTRLEEEVEELARAVEREKRTAEAVRLLRETFRQCRDEMKDALSSPVEARTTDLLGRMGARSPGTYRIGDGLTPQSFRPMGLDRDVSLENLSGGEREQLHLAGRLALAETLAVGERQLVVLDDILMATDEGRIQGVLEVLRSMDRLQILILTCHPTRFDLLADAVRFDLVSLLEDASRAGEERGGR